MHNVNNMNAPNSPNSNKTVDKLKVLQLNTSNADWNTKRFELITTIVNNDPDICIISESNAEVKDPDRMQTRSNMFTNYNLEDKIVNYQTKARVSIVIR